MSEVVHGFCPNCGETTRGYHEAPALGALCYSNEPRLRVRACKCGSRRRPLEDLAAIHPFVPSLLNPLLPYEVRR